MARSWEFPEDRRMTTHRRILVLTALALVGVSSTATAAGGRADSGTAWLSANHSEGGLLIVSGDVKDKILGRAAIVYRITASAGTPGTVNATSKSVTLFTKNGSLTGTGSAVETFNADGTSTVTNGKISLKKGTSKMTGHSLVGTFSGTYANGIYTFTYKATYK
jgi:hypothetical protein